VRKNAPKTALFAPARFVEPCLATVVDRAPSGERWVHEIKHDGYRLMVRIELGKVQLLTRSGLDWTTRFPPVAEAAAALPVQNAYLDGEVVIEDERGHSDWPALHLCATKGRCPKA
jgi:bifunctional non-homologous end joining protein LigD